MAEYVVDRENVWPYGSQREEVVRCRDCESACDHYEGMDVWWCGYLQRYVGSNGFCFWGVRRVKP